MRILTIVLLALTVFSISSYCATAALPSHWFGNKQEMPSLAPMIEDVSPAVVNIATHSYVRQQDNPMLNDPFFRRFFNIPDQQTQKQRRKQSLGSGVIINARKGLILTNNHVIRGADEITVSLYNGQDYPAKLVGSDPATDVALIQIKANNLTALPLADSDTLRIGDFVVAIGNPFGLGQTVTSGIVSALGRSGLGIEHYENFIQTDASINPGNSGGALVNLRGELVGINTAIFSQGQAAGSVGIGFAIPSNLVQQISGQLLEFGEVQRAHLGVQMQDITPELAEAFDLKDTRGAVVTLIMPDSAAEKSGLLVGDVVIAIDGNRMENANNLRNDVGLLRIGQTITLDILRDGHRRTLKATVETTPQKQTSQAPVHPKLLGATFGDLEQSSPYYGKIDGIMTYSVEKGSAAWISGLRPNDIITSINRKEVNDLVSFKERVRGNQPLLLNLIRNQRGMFLLLR
jgi:serine protease Do/serine protease DegQ